MQRVSSSTRQRDEKQGFIDLLHVIVISQGNATPLTLSRCRMEVSSAYDTEMQMKRNLRTVIHVSDSDE